MAPKKIVETAAETLSALLQDPENNFSEFLSQTPSALKLVNAVLSAVAEGQTLVTLTDVDGKTLAFAPRPAGMPASGDALRFFTYTGLLPQPRSPMWNRLGNLVAAAHQAGMCGEVLADPTGDPTPMRGAVLEDPTPFPPEERLPGVPCSNYPSSASES